VKNEAGEWSRTTFENFPTAFMTVIFVITGNWVEPMNDMIRAGYKWSVPYFLEVIIIGQIFLLNLFLAILLQNFGESELE
jgi:voltage-gated sodium channel type II alpha